MLEREPNGSGWQVTLCSQGLVRFLPAAFLCVWLCGWAFGEYFALTILGSALQSAFGPDFLAGWLPVMQGKLPPREALPFFFAFVSVWLAFWTFGGLAALSQLLSLLFGREVVRWSGEGLVIERYALFLISASRLEPGQLTGFRTRGQGLLADTRARAVPVARLGTPAEREELRGMLEEWRKGFGPVAPLAAGESPVPAWQVVSDESGAPAITPVPRTQQAVGAVLMAIAMAFIGAAVAVCARAHGVPVTVGAMALGMPGVLCLYGGAWLLAVRESWHPRRGMLERRRVALGRVWSREFTPLGLELRAYNDSDGDAHWTLVVSGGGKEQVMASSLRDPNLPMSLGTWLSERTGVELVQKGQESRFRKAG
jgi:hypothetical protein